MVGRLLLRGLLAGALAGLLAFAFARITGEPLIQNAISFEEKIHAEHGHSHGDETELVSRSTQAGVGLATGVVVYGAAIGGLFALSFAFLYGRVHGVSARSLSALISVAAFVTVVVVPSLKYPANPPAIGNPETIGLRTELFFLMIITSVIVAVFATKVRSRLKRSMGVWKASTVAGLVYVVIMAALQATLPSIEEVPPEFPATVLWNFRITALGIQAILWASLGLAFGALAGKCLKPSSAPVRVALR